MQGDSRTEGGNYRANSLLDPVAPACCVCWFPRILHGSGVLLGMMSHHRADTTDLLPSKVSSVAGRPAMDETVVVLTGGGGLRSERESGSWGSVVAGKLGRLVLGTQLALKRQVVCPQTVNLREGGFGWE